MATELKEREKTILEILGEQETVDNVDLSKRLNCSVVTIRTAIRNLEKQGKLIRTHGGAVKKPFGITFTLSAGNIFKESESKTKTAKKAYDYIEDRDTIILDDSSNSYHLAKVIKDSPDKYLIIITNSLLVACELADSEHTEVVMIGGLLSVNSPATMGESALEMLRNFRATKAFIGVHGINPEFGITSIGNDQMQIKKLIFEIADQVYVLTSSNKFMRGHLFVAAPLSKVYKIITDSHISPLYKDEVLQATSLDLV